MTRHSSSFHVAPRPPSSTLFPYTTLFRSNRSIRIPCSTASRANKVSAFTGCASSEGARQRLRFMISIARSEEHTSDSSHANISYAVFCLKKKNIASNEEYICECTIEDVLV